MPRHLPKLDLYCPRCGRTGYCKEVRGKRRVYSDGPINCSMLFEGKCRHWDEAFIKAWLAHDGIREE